jgi:two-component system cell cycle sensor histidine kinase/response regulator CckA
MNPAQLTTTILESLPEPHCVLSRDYTCLAVNTGFARLVGNSVEELVGAAAERFWPDAERQRWETRECPAELRSAQGQPLVVKLATFAGDALLVRVLASFSQDQTTKVFHAQRMETLGLLAGGVAHDFNNILTGVLGHLAYLQNVLPADGAHAESLSAIEEGALRASGITQQILKFSRLEQNEPSARVDIGETVSRACLLVKGTIPSEIRLDFSPPARAVSVLASEAYLSQVIINLIVNARDAIKGGGTIDVSIERSCSSEEVSRLFGTEPASPAYGALVVRDSGEGMDDEVKARLFEPYFTTKKQGGTGLGLTTVFAIVKSLGGAIEVSSQKGVGTEFRVVLPVVDELQAKQQTETESEEGPVRGHGERILVVDDEYAVRNVLGLSLTHLGYSVETAASGLDALDRFGEAEGRYDLVILDLLMPGLSGEEVFNRLRRLRPDLRVLIVSGFSSEQVVTRILANGGRDFIQKPFSIEVLSRKVRGCLGD